MIKTEDSANLAELLEKTTAIAESVAIKEGIEADKNARWVGESMRILQSEKLTGLTVPKLYGGHGEGLYALVRICEILGNSYSSVGLCYGMHSVATAVIAAKATEWQKTHYLEPIAMGKHLTTLALSEAGSGAHFYFPQTSLLPVYEDYFLVNGIKTFVTNGSHADSYVLSTMGASEDADPDQFSCIIVDEGTTGMIWGKEWDGLGMRGNSSRSLKLENVTVAGKQILGEQGDQLWYIFNVVAPYFLMAMASTYLGIAQRALDEGRKLLSKRVYTHNGTSLSQVSILQHRLGVLWSRVERTRTLIYHAASLGDEGSPNAIPAILAAKAEVANCCVDTVNDVMTFSGGIGYDNHSLLGMLMRDARASHVMAPTTDILYTWIGRTLLDQPVLSD